MPRRLQAMKDVATCEKLRGAGKRALIRRCPNGETRPTVKRLSARAARSKPPAANEEGLSARAARSKPPAANEERLSARAARAKPPAANEERLSARAARAKPPAA